MKHAFADRDRMAALESALLFARKELALMRTEADAFCKEVRELREQVYDLRQTCAALKALAAWALLQDYWKKVADGQLPFPNDPGRLETAGGCPERSDLLSNNLSDDRKDTDSD